MEIIIIDKRLKLVLEIEKSKTKSNNLKPVDKNRNKTKKNIGIQCPRDYIICKNYV